MLEKIDNRELNFDPSVFGLKDKSVAKSPKLEFQLITDDNQYFSFPSADFKRKINGFNVFDRGGNFIGWLDVYIGGLGSLSYVEHKPDDPKSVFVFNQPLFAGPRDSEQDLINLAQKCARHYHDYLLKTNGTTNWIQIEKKLAEREFNQVQTQGVM